jgi:aryl-alcohol dehydrogenase-like predicted oxidoreductase
MKYRKLGNTGIKVSEIGFGTWGLGGDSYGPTDDEVSLYALQFAFDLGVTFYDTSDLYGGGHSEEILGKAFSGQREKVIIATKVGTLPHTGFYMPQDFSFENISRSIDQSLRRLNTDYVDLYQLHSPQMELDNWDEIILALQQIQQAGKIRHFGISARSPQDAKMAIDQFGFEVVQVNFNMIDHRAVESGLFNLCREKGVGVIARTPLCFGYLSGNLTGEEEFAGLDHRANWPREQLRRWAKSPRLFAPLNLGKDRTLVQLALQFCLSDDAVSTVIPGMMTSVEVRENAAIAQMPPLTREESETIQDIYQGQIFYDAKAKGGIATTHKSKLGRNS